MSYLLSKTLTSIELLGTQTKTKERPNTKTTFKIKHKTTVHYQPNPRLTVSMMINLMIWNMCARQNNHSLFAFCVASNKYIKWFCFPLLLVQWHMGTFPFEKYLHFSVLQRIYEWFDDQKIFVQIFILK